MRILFLVLSFLLCFMFPVSNAVPKVYIDINAPSSTRVPLLVPQFKNIGGNPDARNFASGMAAIISDDLDFSGLFRLIDPGLIDESHLQGLTRDAISWESLSIIGAEAIVTGGFEVSRQKLSTELRLFDAVQGRFITGKKYSGKTDDYRLICHRFSNEIFSRLTGAPGIFETGIVFVKQLGENKELFYMDYDGGNVRQLTNFRSLTLSPEWSPDGTSLAYTSYKDGNPDLYTMDVASGKSEKLSHKKGINISPAWSPDGKKIALTLSLNNGNSEIYTIDIKKRNLERLTRNWATDVSPAWAPNGENITFVSSRSGNPQLYVLHIRKGTVRRLTYGRGNYNTSPTWSPRGDLIAFTGLIDGKFNIQVISPNGTFHQQLTFGQGNNEDPSWSPDGRYIAFCSTRTGQKEIFIMRSDGTGQKRITFGSGEKSDPVWAPFPHK